MCSPQNSAICWKLSEVLSTSQEAVAWGMSGWATETLQIKKGPPLAERPRIWPECRTSPRPEQGLASVVEADISRLLRHAGYPRADGGPMRKVETALIRHMRVGVKADVGEADAIADEE